MSDPGYIFRFSAVGPGAPEAVRVRNMLKRCSKRHQENHLRCYLLAKSEEELLTVMAEIVSTPAGLRMMAPQAAPFCGTASMPPSGEKLTTKPTKEPTP